jgi:transposase-like protein
LSKRQRRHFTAEQKAEFLRRHLVDKVPVSDICNEAKLQPTVFYDWLRTLMAQAPKALEPAARTPSPEKKLEQRIAELEAKLARKDGVIAEILEEHVKLKKELGES